MERPVVRPGTLPGHQVMLPTGIADCFTIFIGYLILAFTVGLSAPGRMFIPTASLYFSGIVCAGASQTAITTLLATYLFRYLPLRLRARSARRRNVEQPACCSTQQASPLFICVLLVATSTPEAMRDARRLIPTLVGWMRGFGSSFLQYSQRDYSSPAR